MGPKRHIKKFQCVDFIWIPVKKQQKRTAQNGMENKVAYVFKSRKPWVTNFLTTDT